MRMSDDQFEARVEAVRALAPDGEGCHSELDDLVMDVLREAAAGENVAGRAAHLVLLEKDMVKACGFWACA